MIDIEKKIVNAIKNRQSLKKRNLPIKSTENMNNIKLEIQSLLQVKNDLSTLLLQESVLTKSYYNQIEDLKGKIRVFCRCRPINKTEIAGGNENSVHFPDIFSVLILGLVTDKNGKLFHFDRVFIPNSTQEDVFNEVSGLLQSVFDGFNVAIFAYGQTGSGKTFTLIGDSDNPGIVPRAFERIFCIIHEGQYV